MHYRQGMYNRHSVRGYGIAMWLLHVAVPRQAETLVTMILTPLIQELHLWMQRSRAGLSTRISEAKKRLSVLSKTS